MQLLRNGDLGERTGVRTGVLPAPLTRLSKWRDQAVIGRSFSLRSGGCLQKKYILIATAKEVEYSLLSDAPYSL